MICFHAAAEPVLERFARCGGDLAKLHDAPSMQKRVKDLAIDAHLEAAILRGCLADRRKRYASAREFQQALAAKG